MTPCDHAHGEDAHLDAAPSPPDAVQEPVSSLAAGSPATGRPAPTADTAPNLQPYRAEIAPRMRVRLVPIENVGDGDPQGSQP